MQVLILQSRLAVTVVAAERGALEMKLQQAVPPSLLVAASAFTGV